jgi:hypothetical protein
MRRQSRRDVSRRPPSASASKALAPSCSRRRLSGIVGKRGQPERHARMTTCQAAVQTADLPWDGTRVREVCVGAPLAHRVLTRSPIVSIQQPVAGPDEPPRPMWRLGRAEDPRLHGAKAVQVARQCLGSEHALMPPYVASPTAPGAAHLTKPEILAVGHCEKEILSCDPAHLRDSLPIVLQMKVLQHLGGQHEVEGPVSEWKVGRRGLNGVGLHVLQRSTAHVDARDGPIACETIRDSTIAAPDVEYGPHPIGDHLSQVLDALFRVWVTDQTTPYCRLAEPVSSRLRL